jgi:uncharacterized protein YbjT (DUF2867 family)
MSIKVILTGATGMVGEGVLMECLTNENVKEVLIVNRKHSPMEHPKLKELIVTDFFHLDEFAEQLKGYDACFYCAGISSAGMKEEKYTYITYDTTLAFAKTILELNPTIVFNFISGSHTDSSATASIMWAKVKGKTENALAKMLFKNVYHFRPGGMLPTTGQKNSKMIYKILVKIIAAILPKQVITMKELGTAMINAGIKGYPKQILEIADIKELAKADLN